MFIICYFPLLAVPHEESKDEWIISGAVETTHTLLTGEYTILHVRQRVSVYRRVVLVGTSEERNVCVHVARESLHCGFPRLVTIGIGTTRELHMQEHPVLEDDAERFGTPVKVAGFLSHIDPGTGTLDGISGLVEHRIKSLNVDGNLTLVVKVGQLLDAQRILVLNPRFKGRTAIVVPGIGEYT